MVGTRSTMEEAQRRFYTVLTETLGLDSQGPIMKSLQQEFILTISDLPMLSSSDIDDMHYKTTSTEENMTIETQNPLSKGHKGWINAFIAFIKYYSIEDEDEINLISRKEFNKFPLNIDDPENRQNFTSSDTNHFRRKKIGAADNFKKSIKRDKSQYNILRDDKQ